MGFAFSSVSKVGSGSDVDEDIILFAFWSSSIFIACRSMISSFSFNFSSNIFLRYLSSFCSIVSISSWLAAGSLPHFLIYYSKSYDKVIQCHDQASSPDLNSCLEMIWSYSSKPTCRIQQVFFYSSLGFGSGCYVSFLFGVSFFSCDWFCLGLGLVGCFGPLGFSWYKCASITKGSSVFVFILSRQISLLDLVKTIGKDFVLKPGRGRKLKL